MERVVPSSALLLFCFLFCRSSVEAKSTPGRMPLAGSGRASPRPLDSGAKQTGTAGLVGSHAELPITTLSPMVMDPATVANSLWHSENNPHRWLYKTDVYAIVPINVVSDNDLCYVIDEASDAFSAPTISLVDCNPKEARYRLAYLPIRNRGEVIRLCLEESGVPYELEIIGYEAWEVVKSGTQQGKLPILRNYDGKGTDLFQEQAITRYLAAELGFAGSNKVERAKVDMLYSLWFATMRNNGLSHDGEHYSVASLKHAAENGKLKDVKKGSPARPKYGDVFRVNSLGKAERSLMILDYFEEVLKSSKSGFLVGNLTYVDFALFYCLFELAEEDNCPQWAEYYRLPNLKRFLERMESRPRIQSYLKSPRRMPRYARSSDGSSTYNFIPGKWSPIPPKN